MSSRRLLHWGGLVTIVVAALFALGGILAAVVPGGGLSGPLVPLLYYLGTVTAVLALIALYAAQWRETGMLGLAGFLLAVVGSVLYSGPQFALVAGMSGAAGWHDVWGFGMGNVLLAGPPAFFIGMILLGAASRRGRVLPGGSGALLAIGAFVWLIAYFLSLVPGLLTVASVTTAAALAWMGWTLWSNRTNHVATRPHVV